MFQKISKYSAKSRYERGESVTLCPSKCYPHTGPFSCAIEVSKTDRDREFSRLVNEFSYYNCNSETGNGVHFYVRG